MLRSSRRNVSCGIQRGDDFNYVFFVVLRWFSFSVGDVRGNVCFG